MDLLTSIAVAIISSLLGGGIVRFLLLRIEKQQAQANVDNTKAEAETKKAEADRTKTENDNVAVRTLRETLDSLKARSDSQETLIQSLRDRLDKAEAEIEELREKYHEMQSKNGQLALENRRLRQVITELHKIALSLQESLEKWVPAAHIKVPPLCDLLGDE